MSPPAAIVASLGLVLATVYALWLVQRVFHGRTGEAPAAEESRGHRPGPASHGFRRPAAGSPSLGPGDGHDGRVRDRRALAGALSADAHPHGEAHGRLAATTDGHHGVTAGPVAQTASTAGPDEPAVPATASRPVGGEAMTGLHLLGVAPFIVLGGTAVVAMLVSAFVRSHWPSSALTMAGIAGVARERRCSWPPRATDGRPSSSAWTTTRSSSSACWWSPPGWWCLLSYGYLERTERESAEYYVLILLATLGAAMLVASSHFASFFLGLEVLSVALYGLIAYPGAAPVRGGGGAEVPGARRDHVGLSGVRHGAGLRGLRDAWPGEPRHVRRRGVGPAERRCT